MCLLLRLVLWIVNIWLNTVFRWQKKKRRVNGNSLQFAWKGNTQQFLNSSFSFYFAISHSFKTKRPSNVVWDLYSSGMSKAYTLWYSTLEKPFKILWNDSAHNCTMTYDIIKFFVCGTRNGNKNWYEEHFCPIHFSVIWIAVILSPFIPSLKHPTVLISGKLKTSTYATDAGWATAHNRPW